MRVPDSHLRLLTWNVNGRVGVLGRQVAAIARRAPDLVALQEVTRSSLPGLKRGLGSLGLTHQADSFSVYPRSHRPRGPRRYGLLIASRFPLHGLERAGGTSSWPERVLAVSVQSKLGRIHLYNAHIPPGSSNGWIKVEVLEGLYRRLASRSRVPRILVGDFNTPQSEGRSGRVVTWGGAHEPGSRWDAAERAILQGLGAFDLSDVYRGLHGYERRAFSWYPSRGRRRIGRRYDHLFASRLLHPVRCEYLHEVRRAGLSDHSALEATFQKMGSPISDRVGRRG